ncbi:ABC transporter permease [Aciditerrimonas ferrireducens]|uniref:ABC transporter permease n=1 Tax=Aciditerrimonas ferrireducens TaxID=667306 RepID=UPI002005DB56|nr:ABC transporter permease [Aciditerrimonas ferrireducens]MCK4177998.1 ABC transporter permease [Aciditerrimonas ferrireducens]
MNLLETLRSGLEAIAAHRLRSALTVLGILIGVAAVILTVGLGEGATSSVNAAISSLGATTLIVTPGSTTSSDGVRGGFGSSTALTTTDADALASRVDCPDVAAVAPSIAREEVLSDGTTTWTTSVVGTTPAYAQILDRTMAEGSFFTQAQVQEEADVVVLGPTTAEELGLGFDPVGQTVDVAGVPMTVQGVLAEASSGATGTAEDDLALVPITTAQSQLFGTTSVSEIYLAARSTGVLGAAEQEAEDELLNLQGATSPADADFTITSETSILSTADSVDNTLTVLLAGIAAISLLVGGIGVMNIMLVSVTERVREIGLRKALGATPASIRRQFLTEASTLGLAGGLVGALVGVAGAVGLPHVISDHIDISGAAIAGAIVVSVGIGLVFGVYPATRAARLTPIDALRSE